MNINTDNKQMEDTSSYDINTYFASNPDLFESRMNIPRTIFLLIITIIVAATAYIMWFQPEMISSMIEWSRKARKAEMFGSIIKWVSTIFTPILAFILVGGGVRKFYDKKSWGEIKRDFLEKHISSENVEVKDWFIQRNFEDILRLPVISSYYNKDYSILSVAHNSEAKKLYFLCNYQFFDPVNHGKLISSVETENLKPIEVSGEEYFKLLPLINANIEAVKEVKKAETLEKNIIVTPNIPE